jgi:carboxypeptidase C (cathepsin A)
MAKITKNVIISFFYTLLFKGTESQDFRPFVFLLNGTPGALIHGLKQF